MQVEFKLNSSF